MCTYTFIHKNTNVHINTPLNLIIYNCMYLYAFSELLLGDMGHVWGCHKYPVSEISDPEDALKMLGFQWTVHMAVYVGIINHVCEHLP